MLVVALSCDARLDASADPDTTSTPSSRTAALVDTAAIVQSAMPTPAAASSAQAEGGLLAPRRLTLAKMAELGFENVTLDQRPDTTIVAFENRRYRHTIDALGRIVREGGPSIVALERRLGLDVAAITLEGTPERPRFRVRYPTDKDFPKVAHDHLDGPTSHSVDLLVGPLLAYELGRVTQPVQFQFQVEPRIRYNPWAGARATASVVIPVYNDFFVSDLHPDVDELRPGLATLEQFAWVPRMALVSATAGLLGDNRYGISVGGARPLWEGQILLDGQIDLTGFIAFNPIDEPKGVVFSEMTQWSSFFGVTWRPPLYDISIRGRLATYLYGDQGEELEVKRSLGDVDFALFSLRTNGSSTKGVRITIPIPPMTRGTRRPVRVQPIERFPFGYRTETETVGLFLTGVASREDYLRQLSAPALNDNLDRFHRARGDAPPQKKEGIQDWISLAGTTGFINTPWAGTMKDGSIELEYNYVPKKWADDAYDQQKEHNHERWSLTLGLVPRVEVSMRFTRIPGKKGFVDDPNNLLTTDTDHMASGRLTLLTSTPRRPSIAVGVDDVEGTRRFHSSYVVAGYPSRILHVQNRFCLGYAPSVFTATRHLLEGGFGAFEVIPWRDVALRVEYDTDKWNAGVGVGLGFGLRLRAAALNMESLSVGVGWYHGL